MPFISFWNREDIQLYLPIQPPSLVKVDMSFTGNFVSHFHSAWVVVVLVTQ